MGKEGCRVTLASKGPEDEAVNCQDIGPASWPKEEVGEEQPALGRSSGKMILGIASVPESWQEQAKGVSRIEGRGFVAAVLTRRRLENSGRVTAPSAQSFTPGALRISSLDALLVHHLLSIGLHTCSPSHLSLHLSSSHTSLVVPSLDPSPALPHPSWPE